MEAKEKWISETIESIDSIQKAEANHFLYDKVIHRLNSQSLETNFIKPKAIYRLAACIVLFIGFNVFTILHFNSSVVTSQNNSSVFANEYFSFINNI